MIKQTDTKKLAEVIYRRSLDMALSAGIRGSHIGGSLSSVEIFAVLYGEILRYDVNRPRWDGRDRLIVSKAHCILSHFAALSTVGFFPESELYSFHERGGLLCGHPYRPEIGLEFCGGSLGMGISVGIGMALVAKMEQKKHHIYILLGDGECNEGSVWEGFMAAGQYSLNNLTVIIDYNNMQFDGKNEEIMSLIPLDQKLQAFGFTVSNVDGHDVGALRSAFKTDGAGKPRAVIAHTIKAHGIKRLEGKPESHQTILKKEDYMAAIVGGEAY